MTTNKAASGLALRYSCEGSHAHPQTTHFAIAEWVSEAECRHLISLWMCSPKIDQESLMVTIQHRKSRWLRHWHGPAREAFPDLKDEIKRETAIKAVLEDPELPYLVKSDAKHAFESGQVGEALLKARLLARCLERLMEIDSSLGKVGSTTTEAEPSQVESPFEANSAREIT
jgi:hypothetical protein